jgi:hypothetical protein
MLKRINDILPELILGIFIYGIIIQLTGVWFFKDKLLYTTGLWFGVLIAMGMAVHMAVIILDTVDMAIEKKAKRTTTLFSLLRFIVVIVIFLLVAYFKLGNVILMFIGVMGLKASAYFWPFTHKYVSKIKGRGDVSADGR